jgi:hypothetical protein
MYCVKPAKQLINVHDLTDELKIYHYDTYCVRVRKSQGFNFFVLFLAATLL